MTSTPREGFPPETDPSIAAVLEEYHDRIAREKSAPRRTDDLDSRLLAVGPSTGRLINLLARALRAPTILEIGTSYGYSGIWLADAARASGGHLITMEISPEKSAFARQMSERAGLAEHVEFRVGDAIELISAMPERADFVLVDHWNALYLPALRVFAPKLNPGAVIVTDNIRPGDSKTHDYLEALKSIPGMSSVNLAVGSGIEVARYLPEAHGISRPDIGISSGSSN